MFAPQHLRLQSSSRAHVCSPPAATAATTHQIEFKLVDEDSGEPVGGVTLKLKLPSGEVREVTSGGDGKIKITDLDAGNCDIEGMSDDEAYEVVSVG